MAPVPTLERPPRPPDELDHTIHLTDPDDELELGGGRMTFLEHLDELRKRLIGMVGGILVGCIVSFSLLPRIFRFIMVPLQQMLPDGGKMITTAGPEYFMLHIKVGLLGGLVVAAPWVLFQIWLFVAPGLYSHEKRFTIPFVAGASVFFFGGAAFAHYVAFPVIWRFFIDFSSDEFVVFMPRIGDVLSLYMKIVLGLGIVFQMPVLVLALARMGLVTAGFLFRNFKYALLIIAILGAVLSPGGDIVGQLVMGGPMLVLYVFSIGVAWVFQKRRKAEI
ncbi:MAG: twin-arginine translocase subunit TatC [Acidobacteria bacterium]|nr:twin-arginine translocase subunit TatC [Acidobacteriota bacterium]